MVFQIKIQSKSAKTPPTIYEAPDAETALEYMGNFVRDGFVVSVIGPSGELLNIPDLINLINDNKR
jgi:hypothetical protein